MASVQNAIVGILISPNSLGFDTNGLHQNSFFLYRLLKQIKGVTPILVYAPEFLPERIKADDQIDLFGEPVYRIDLFYEKYHLTVLLEICIAIDSGTAKKLRRAGTKIVMVAYGNRYVLEQEAICFGHLPRSNMSANYADRNLLRETTHRDAIWMSPHFAWQKDYYKHRFNANVAHVCPYVWDPEMVDKRYKDSGLYKDKSPAFHPNNPANKNVFSTEPNINVLKTSLFPFQAFNLAYETLGDELGDLYLYNTAHVVKENKKITSYFSHFPSTQAGKIKCLSRHGYPHITNSAQIMFHHHFQNGLNYTLLEAARLRLPIVHNSEFMPELGYYYSGANLTAASAQIVSALSHQDRDDLEEYDHQCDKVIEKFWIHNRENIRGYQTLIANLLDSSIEPELPQYIVDLENKLDHGDGYISPLG
jgi:hypothetical protein